MVSSIFFNFFLETNISIQLGLRQCLFDVNRVSIRGDILKKLRASHHVSEADSTVFSENPCFCSRQKIHWPTFVSSFYSVYRECSLSGEHSLWISPSINSTFSSSVI